MDKKIKLGFFYVFFSNCIFGQYNTVIKPMPSENLLIDDLKKNELVYRKEKVFVFMNKIERDDRLFVPPQNLSEGKYLAFYNNDTSKLAFENCYNKKGINGFQKQYYINGKQMFLINYKDGKLDGAYIHYSANGQIISVSNYRNGKLHGEELFYLKNGVKETEYNYKNGELSGVSKVWNEKGQLIKEEFYKNGKLKRVKKY